MKSIHLFFILILIIFQSCTSSSNNQLATLVNDVISEKEAFIDKIFDNTEKYAVVHNTKNFSILLKTNNPLWNLVEIINDGKSDFIYPDFFKYDNNIGDESYLFKTNEEKPTTLRYYGVNTVFDTTLLIKKGDIINPPFGLNNFYYKIFEQEPSFNMSITINGETIESKPEKEEMIPINFLNINDTDTVFLVIETIACFYHNVESYMYYMEDESIIFERNNEFCTNDIDDNFCVEPKTISQSYFYNVINKFRKDLSLELGEMSISNTNISIIKGNEIAVIDIFNTSSYSLSNLLKTI